MAASASAPRQQGFTLLEILVALGILVFGIMVLMQTLGTAAQHTRMLDERTAAWLVAADKLVEYQVYSQWLEVGTQDQVLPPAEDDASGRSWQVRTVVSAGPYPDTRRVDIEVGPPTESGRDRQVMYTLTSLIGKPASSTSVLRSDDGGDPQGDEAGTPGVAP